MSELSCSHPYKAQVLDLESKKSYKVINTHVSIYPSTHKMETVLQPTIGVFSGLMN